MELSQLIEWAFMGVISGGVAWSATFLGKISRSISQLNVQVSTILERTAWHEKEIERHNSRITRLEQL